MFSLQNRVESEWKTVDNFPSYELAKLHARTKYGMNLAHECVAECDPGKSKRQYWRIAEVDHGEE
jgi:hypothetical protein